MGLLSFFLLVQPNMTSTHSPPGFDCRIFKIELAASVKCRREIFGRANFHPRVVSLGFNVSSKAGDNGRRTGEGREGTVSLNRKDTPPLHSRLFNV